MKLNNFFYDKVRWQAAGDPPSAPPSEPPPAPENTGAPDLSFIPGDFVKDGTPDIAAFSAHYQDIVAREAQAAERMAQVPEAYDFTFPADMKFEGLDLPEGFTVTSMADDPTIKPLFDEFGSFLKELGAPAAAASKATELLARYEATKFSSQYAAAKAEREALGTPAQQEARLGSIQRSLEAKLPEGQAKALLAATTTADGVKALEALLRPTGHLSTPAQPKAPDIEGLSPIEKLKLANSQRT